MSFMWVAVVEAQEMFREHPWVCWRYCKEQTMVRHTGWARWCRTAVCQSPSYPGERTAQQKCPVFPSVHGIPIQHTSEHSLKFLGVTHTVSPLWNLYCDLCWLDIFRSSLLLWGGCIWRELSQFLGRTQSAFRDCCLSLENKGLFSTRNNYGHVWHLQQSLKNRTNTLPSVIISAILFEISISWESGTLWLQSTPKHNRFSICGVNGSCWVFFTYIFAK